MSDGIPQELAARLRNYQQQHLAHWWPDLDDTARQQLSRQIAEVDFELIERLMARDGGHSPDDADTPAAKAHRATQPEYLIRLDDQCGSEFEQATAAGNDAIDSGKVGAILVAGGQGTRLGFDQPKGMFPIGPISGNTLFQLLAEQVLARGRRSSVAIPYYIMTSDATHRDTVAFFEQHDYFGLGPENVRFFQQGTMPAVDAESGKLLLADKGRLSTSPDGHGGMLAALAKSAMLEDMRERGIEYLYYHQVDNPTAIVCDPTFIGYHILKQSEMSTKVVAKRSAEEKMGVAVSVDGKTQIIEYSDLPTEVAELTDADGGLLHWAGSTAIHVFDRDFLQRLADDATGLPFHLANKQVPYLSEDGQSVTPDSPNAFKFERFIFDSLPLASRAMVYEASREREFNPVKNSSGNDSPETAQKALISIFRKWIESAGGKVDEGVAVEISPLYALDADELSAKPAHQASFHEPVYLH